MTPIYKVGAVVLRGLRAAAPEVLIIQPRPKPATPHDMPNLGLVRGTRQYWDEATQQWRDARDAEAASLHATTLEPLTETLRKEIHEEAGIDPEMLRASAVYDMGAHLFPSATKPPYMIHWFVVMLDEASQQKQQTATLMDSVFSQWATIEMLQQFAAQKRMTAGYVEVVNVAVAGMRAQQFSKVIIT